MKKLQILIIFAILSLAYSCDSENPVDDSKKPVEETEGIELIAPQGTEISESLDSKLAEFHTQIKNIGTKDINVYASMEIIELSSGMTSYFCWGDLSSGGLCYPPLTDDMTSDFTLTIKSGETTPEGNFTNYIGSESNFGGTAKIRYIVFEENNESNADTIVYNIKFGL